MRKGGKENISNTIYVDEEKERTKDRSLGNTCMKRREEKRKHGHLKPPFVSGSEDRSGLS